MSEHIRGSYDDALYKSTYTLPAYLTTCINSLIVPRRRSEVTPLWSLKQLIWSKTCTHTTFKDSGIAKAGSMDAGQTTEKLYDETSTPRRRRHGLLWPWPLTSRI